MEAGLRQPTLSKKQPPTVAFQQRFRTLLGAVFVALLGAVMIVALTAFPINVLALFLRPDLLLVFPRSIGSLVYQFAVGTPSDTLGFPRLI